MLDDLFEFLKENLPQDKDEVSAEFIQQLRAKVNAIPHFKKAGARISEFLVSEKCRYTFEKDWIRDKKSKMTQGTLSADDKRKILLNAGYKLIQDEVWGNPKITTKPKKRKPTSSLEKFYAAYEDFDTKQTQQKFDNLVKKYGEKEKKQGNATGTEHGVSESGSGDESLQG